MLRTSSWTIVALSFVITGAAEELTSCAGESSLLQKQHHRSARTLVPVENAAALTFTEIPDEVLANLIVSTQWNCDLLPHAADPRGPTCGLSFKDTGLHPANLTELGNNSHDHMNSMRMLFPVGALPCCSTMPFCGAPACKADATNPKTDAGAAPAPTCTKSSAQDNFAYMSSVEMWPAYHGWGGSYEIDVMKHVDILGTLLRQDGRVEPVDLVIDIGANSGFITEKLTTRHFGKNYILVDAFIGMRDMFRERLGNESFKEKWFKEQVPDRSGAVIPNFDFLNYAVANKSGGSLDLCMGAWAMWGAVNDQKPCPVDKVALGDVIPSRLSPTLSAAFAAAESAYIKVDVEGYDQMALQGMSGVLQEERGTYSNGEIRHLVNFIQLEVCVVCTEAVKKNENLSEYDVKTVTTFLESMGFEVFLMGPRYLPLSHGSWDDSFNAFFSDAENSNAKTYPAFHDIHCPGTGCPGETPSNDFTADLFALRKSHPRATEIKLALGSCQESHDFSLTDEQYEIVSKPASA